jgi:hypothetical protein
MSHLHDARPQRPAAASPCPAAALGPVKVLQWVEAAALLAEALVHTITHNAADLWATRTAQHSRQAGQGKQRA